MAESACPGCQVIQRRIAELETRVERLSSFLEVESVPPEGFHLG
jgi:hypothetical protein